MKKLRLALDELRVDSFRTGTAAAAGGTVAGYADRPWITLPTDDTAEDRSRIESCYDDTCHYGCPCPL